MFKVLALAFLGVSSAYPSFEEWTATNGVEYKTVTESNYRSYIYDQNIAKIEEHNAGNHTWTMGVNKFADLTAEEFKARYTGGFISRHHAHGLRGQRVISTALPASVDWSAKGAVTPVKNQGQCGSCWSFSATGALEGAWFLNTTKLVSLSEQQLVDCSTAEGNQGCNGGLMDYAFQYVIDNKGLTTEAAYPYTATGPNTCAAKGKPVAVTITGFTDVTPNSETALLTAIVQQPVAVAVEADQNSFQLYSGGVMTQACGTNLDHGVLAVGYGTDATSGKDYYKIKNSWGADWGMAGYILLARGTYNGNQGQCGVQMDPSYPVV